MNAQKIFSENIVFLRRQKNLRQSDIAAAIGISDKTYSKWETGETDPGISSVIRLAEFFGVAPSRLLEPEQVSDTEAAVDRMLSDLPPEEAVQKSFEIQFHAIRGLAKRGCTNPQFREDFAVQVPENRVNTKNTHAITAYASGGVYEMMYNGTDANIALSMLPNSEDYAWLTAETELLSRYLGLVGSIAFLKCLIYMADRSFAEKYTADYLAQTAGIDPEAAEKLLEECTGLGICSKSSVHIGDKTETLYRTEADQMLRGILTLAHLSLPGAEKNGCYYFNCPARQIMVKGQVK